MKQTSWENVNKWYRDIVGEEGHYYHQHVIMPGLVRLLKFDKKETVSIIDLACGQGVLARRLPEKMRYCGVDISPAFIKDAIKMDSNPNHLYLVCDIAKPLALKQPEFSHAVCILAIQNISDPLTVFKNAYKQLQTGGKFIIVMNHPCFRIPRQSSWAVDEQKKIQYRRLDRYFSSMEIPIQAHPSKGKESVSTVSFHHSLSTYTKWLSEAGFVIETLEEWCSDKESTGKNAKMENRARQEFPLFLTLVLRK